MGLDMYLMSRRELVPTRKKDKHLIEMLNGCGLHETTTYLSNWDDKTRWIRDGLNARRLIAQFGEICLVHQRNGAWSVESEAMYWRKANHLHNWFVANVQDGIDDCGKYVVTLEQLGELHSTIERVLSNKTLADELLPTSSGFFFGDTEYNEYYFTSLRRTKTLLTNILKLKTSAEWVYEYHSSW